MLTPAKIKNHHFESAGRNAYRADGVDRFFEEVAASYEQMFRENGEMYKKISLLAERLEEYRNDEDNIRNALLTAQRMSEKIQREAREAADALVAEAQLRAQTENERVDAETNQMMAQATYRAKSLIEEAQKQAEKIIYDATYESKAAAVSARDVMIKEEAALEMMKVEVTKFKKQILDAYSEQVALIEQLPELVHAKLTQEQAVAEEVEPEVEIDVEVEVEVEAEVTQEPEAEVIDAPVEEAEEETVAPEAVAAFEAAESEPESVDDFQAEDVNVDQLQQMIDEAVDTDAEDEAYAEDIQEDTQEVEEFSGEYVIPEVDEESDYAHLNDIVNNFEDNTPNSNDVFFSKAAKQNNEEKQGFKVNFDKISSQNTVDEDYIDELDEDFDNDDDEGLATKFKSFFKK